MHRDFDDFPVLGQGTNFERLYLRAQMELEGVLGRKEYLLDLIKALEPTGGAENALQSRETKCIIIFLNISRIGWFWGTNFPRQHWSKSALSRFWKG